MVPADIAARKLCIQWLPHNFTNAQILRRVIWCREMMQKLAGGDSSAVYDIVTRDESWIYYYDPETKKTMCSRGSVSSIGARERRLRAPVRWGPQNAAGSKFYVLKGPKVPKGSRLAKVNPAP
ncbi:hypothetical protein EVAR_30779_1 [Eumeta japonica]|uniref:Mariner Mos1 transposase n=1 Tax=Eumeta variegata TaxID=151549 RepID=A0A4C1V919_EUMVA|nr:hypothetical protein EVAR_30779_1 [Eumeta japonica]